MPTMRVQVMSDAGRPLADYRVTALFAFTPPDITLPVAVNSQEAALTAVDGFASLPLPAVDQIAGVVRLQVSAHDGELLDQQEIATSALTNPITVRVRPPTAASAAAPAPAAASPRVRGMVIDPMARNGGANRQVVIWATPTAPPDAEAEIVTIADTDSRGYFSATMPSGTFAEASAMIEGAAAAVRIRLRGDGSFPEHVILGFEPATPSERSGDVPRHPNTEELVNSPSVFTADGLSGEFASKPNRVLEAFDYYTVVRTSEPLIKGLTLEDPPKVSLDDVSTFMAPRLYGAMQAHVTLWNTSSNSSVTSESRLLATPAATEAVAAKNIGGGAFDTAGGSDTANLYYANVRNRSTDGLNAIHWLKENQPAAEVDKVRIDAQIARVLAYDPDGFSLTGLANAELETRKGDFGRWLDLLRRGTGGRGELTAKTAVDWDETPTFYQTCTIAHGHILHLRQEWVADGYSLGDLVYSLPLAPGQKKQIAVIDWDRREIAGRSESLHEEERLSAYLRRDRDISEIAGAAARESTWGTSSVDTDSFSAGGGIAGFLTGGIGAIGGLFGASGGTSGSSSTAEQHSSRSTSAHALQQLSDRVSQGASAVRNQRATVVQTVRQGETMRVQTEVVANHNHAHAMTVQYFEVLRHFLVRHGLAGVQECLFVPLMMSLFDSAKALRWRTALSHYLIDRRLARGFDALQRIADEYNGHDVPTGSYADEELEDLEGFIRVRFELVRPHDEDDGAFLRRNWTPLELLGFNVVDFYNQYLKGQNEKEQIFIRQLGPEIAEKIINGLRFIAVTDTQDRDLPLDPTLLSEFRNKQSLRVSLRLAKPLDPITRKSIRAVRISTSFKVGGEIKSIDDVLPKGSRVIVESGHLKYQTQHLHHDLFGDSHILNDLSGTDPVYITTPLSRQEKRRPRVEDTAYANALLKHLNDHIEYYHRVLWWTMDPERRYMLLDGFIAPNSGERSVASVVENRLIAIVGNCLVLPVAHGFRLNPGFRDANGTPKDLLEHYKPEPVKPMPVAIPTKGVFAEAVLGNSNAAEVIDESRFWRWDESPNPDEPTSILPPSTDSRRAEVPSLAPKDFPSPIVAFQNVPAAPNPQGFGGLLTLLSNPNLFRDITGLTENQKNALAALQASFSTTQALAGKAADLVLQDSMRKDIDKSLNKINEARQKKLITDEQARNLSEAALRAMIGGGSGTPDEKQRLTQEPDVKRAIRNAGTTPGSEINVKRSTPTATENVTVKTPPGTDSGRSYIIADDLTADRRAFNPTARDKSGIVKLSVRVPNLPEGATIRWSAPDPTADEPGTISLRSTTGESAEVLGLHPGRARIDVAVVDEDGRTIESQRFLLSVPQFVTVKTTAAFEQVLKDYSLSSSRDAILSVAKRTSEVVLSTANVRLLWQTAPFNESLPAHLAGSGYVVSATYRDRATRALFGTIKQGPSGMDWGPAAFDEIIDLYPAAFSDSMVTGAVQDIDEITRGVMGHLFDADLASSQARNNVEQIVGRLLGENLAHEICHALVGRTIGPDGHYSTPRESDLMNRGINRSFRDRTAFEITALMTTIDFSNLTDHGIGFINGPTGPAQATITAVAPVAPPLK